MLALSHGEVKDRVARVVCIVLFLCVQVGVSLVSPILVELYQVAWVYPWHHELDVVDVQANCGDPSVLTCSYSKVNLKVL